MGVVAPYIGWVGLYAPAAGDGDPLNPPPPEEVVGYMALLVGGGADCAWLEGGPPMGGRGGAPPKADGLGPVGGTEGMGAEAEAGKLVREAGC